MYFYQNKNILSNSKLENNLINFVILTNFVVVKPLTVISIHTPCHKISRKTSRTTPSHPSLPLSSRVIDIIIVVAKTRLARRGGKQRKGKEKIKRRKSTFSSLAPLCSRIRDAKHKGGLPAPPVAYKPGLTFHPPRPIVFLLSSFLPSFFPPSVRVANGAQSKVNVGQMTDRKFPTRIATRARIIQGPSLLLVRW